MWCSYKNKQIVVEVGKGSFVRKGLALVWVCENLQFRMGEYIKIFIYIYVYVYIYIYHGNEARYKVTQDSRVTGNLPTRRKKGGMEQSRMSRITTFLQARGPGEGRFVFKAV